MFVLSDVQPLRLYLTSHCSHTIHRPDPLNQDVCQRFEGGKQIPHIELHEETLWKSHHLTSRAFRLRANVVSREENRRSTAEFLQCEISRLSELQSKPAPWSFLTVWERYTSGTAGAKKKKLKACMVIYLGRSGMSLDVFLQGGALIRHTFLPESLQCGSASRRAEGIFWYSSQLPQKNPLFSCQRGQRSGSTPTPRPQKAGMDYLSRSRTPQLTWALGSCYSAVLLFLTLIGFSSLRAVSTAGCKRKRVVIAYKKFRIMCFLFA